MTALQSLLSALVRDARLRQIAIAERAGMSTKHLSQMLSGRVEGTLTMWQAVLDAAGISLPASMANIDHVEAAAYQAGWNDRGLAGALQKLADEWRAEADEDERYMNRAHASEIHDVMATVRINRAHADAIKELLADA